MNHNVVIISITFCVIIIIVIIVVIMITTITSAFLVTLREFLLPRGQIQKDELLSTNLERKVFSKMQVVFSPPKVLPESDLIVRSLLR